MTSLKTLALPCLNDRELEAVHGSGGELAVSFTAPPLRGNVELTHQSARTSLTGTLSTDGKGWGAGLSAGFHPSPNVNLEAYANTNGRNHEWGIKGRIRFIQVPVT